MREARSYTYDGPPEIRARVRPGRDGGVPIGSAADARRWLEGRDREERDEPFTYVVDLGGTLLLAPRRSEHVACAGGAPVLAAGEITFDGGAAVVAVTNQSTGYRPDPSCWPAVAAALDRAGLRRPGGFTDAFTFRRCAGCGQLNLVKDAFPGCAVCDADLPDLPDPPGGDGPDA